MKCPYCGNAAEKDNIYCGWCGARLIPADIAAELAVITAGNAVAESQKTGTVYAEGVTAKAADGVAVVAADGMAVATADGMSVAAETEYGRDSARLVNGNIRVAGKAAVSGSQRAEGMTWFDRVYNVDGIRGFGLSLIYFVMMALNIVTFVCTYHRTYSGGNPVLLLIGAIVPIIGLVYSVKGLTMRRNCRKGNILTEIGFVINILILAALLIGCILIVLYMLGHLSS